MNQQHKQPDARDMIELPGNFLFKVIVRQDCVDRDSLRLEALAAIDREPARLDITERDSSKGSYRSYTLDIHILEFEEIERIYAAFRRVEGVVWVL